MTCSLSGDSFSSREKRRKLRLRDHFQHCWHWKDQGEIRVAGHHILKSFIYSITLFAYSVCLWVCANTASRYRSLEGNSTVPNRTMHCSKKVSKPDSWRALPRWSLRGSRSVLATCALGFVCCCAVAFAASAERPSKHSSVSSAGNDAYLENLLLLEKVKNATGKAEWFLDSHLFFWLQNRFN